MPTATATETSGADAQVAHLARAQVGVGIGVVEGQRARGRGGALGPHVVAGGLDGGLDLGATGHGRIDPHGGALGGQVDVGLGHAVGVAQEALDAVDAGGAGHAFHADRELDGLGCRHGHGSDLAADRSDGVDADDHVDAGVVAELQADLALVHELGQEAALALAAGPTQ